MTVLKWCRMTGITINNTAMQKAIADFTKIAETVAADVIEEKAREITTEAKRLAGIKTKTHSGRLIAGINYRLKKSKKGIYASVKSAAKNPKKPKRPGKRNANLSESSYKNGVPYPKILEFSPRFGFRPSGEAYSHFASLYPAADVIAPTVAPEIRKRLLAKYREVYN